MWAELTRFYSLCVLIPCGLFGNILSVIAFTRGNLQTLDCRPVLTALGIADSLLLLSEIPVMLSDIPLRLPITSSSDAACITIYFVRDFARMWSALLVTTLSIERCYQITRPTKTNPFRKKTIHILVIGAILSMTSAVHVPVTMSVVHMEFGTKKLVCSYHSATRMWYKLHVLIVRIIIRNLVTGFVVLVCSILTSVFLIKHARDAGSLLSANGKVTSVLVAIQFRITTMLLTISVMFIILRVPNSIAWLIGHYWLLPSRYVFYFKVINITYAIDISNYAINFLLYCVSAKVFRQEFINLFSCLKFRSYCKLVYVMIRGRRTFISKM